MKRLPAFLVLALSVCSATASADASLIEQIRFELKDELYPIEKVAPGYARPPVGVPRLAVGEFRIDDDRLRPWSQGIAEILRWRIQYVPNVRLLMPSSYYTAVDARADIAAGRPLLTRLEDFQGLKQTLGIETVLTGRLASEGESFVLDAELVDSVSGERLAEKGLRVPSRELPEAIIETSAWVYAELGIELQPTERTFLEDPRSLRAEAITAFIDVYEKLQTEDRLLRRDLISDLRERFPENSLFAAYALHAQPFAMNLEEAYENLEAANRLSEQFPGHAGVRLETYRTMDIASQPKHEVSSRLAGLRDLMVENPDDPMIMINYANALGTNGSTREALAVILEAASRWPDHYRVWWASGWLLNTHAWQVRGDRMWRDVPETAKGRFKLLSYLADQAVDKALSLHDRNGDLWILKLNSVGSKGGYSKQLMEVFDKAVAVAPSSENVYGNALNFSQDKWGGNASARRYIIELAEKNNPEAAWPKVMRSQNAADFEGLAAIRNVVGDRFTLDKIMDHPDFWTFVYGLLGLALVAYGYYAVRRPDAPSDDVRHRASGNAKRGVSELTHEEMLKKLQADNRKGPI